MVYRVYTGTMEKTFAMPAMVDQMVKMKAMQAKADLLQAIQAMRDGETREQQQKNEQKP